MHERLFLVLFKEMGKELPEELHQGARSQPHGHLILEPKHLMTTPVMVIRVKLLAVTTPTIGKARLRMLVMVTWEVPLLTEYGNRTLEVMVVLVTQ